MHYKNYPTAKKGLVQIMGRGMTNMARVKISGHLLDNQVLMLLL